MLMGFFFNNFNLLKVEIKRTIPRGAAGSKDFKTKKIFVGGIPTTVNEGVFNFCSLSFHVFPFFFHQY